MVKGNVNLLIHNTAANVGFFANSDAKLFPSIAIIANDIAQGEEKMKNITVVTNTMYILLRFKILLLLDSFCPATLLFLKWRNIREYNTIITTAGRANWKTNNIIRNNKVFISSYGYS